MVAQVGVGGQPIDLAVRGVDGRFLLAVACDGRAYRDTPTARDRDRLRYEVLERLGWQVHRVWSADWILDPRRAVERVRAAVERARRLGDGELVDETPLAVLKPEDRPSQGRPRADLVPGNVGAAPARAAQPAVQPAAPPRSARAAEPAASQPPASQPVVSEPGLPPVVTSAATPAVPPPKAPARPVGDAGARASGRPTADPPRPGLWVVRLPTGHVSVTAAPRRIDEIARAEIEGAIRAVLARAFAMPADDLCVAVARELGFQRTGAKIRAAVEAALRRQLAAGAVVEVGGNVRLRDTGATR